MRHPCHCLQLYVDRIGYGHTEEFTSLRRSLWHGRKLRRGIGLGRRPVSAERFMDGFHFVVCLLVELIGYDRQV